MALSYQPQLKEKGKQSIGCRAASAPGWQVSSASLPDQHFLGLGETLTFSAAVRHLSRSFMFALPSYLFDRQSPRLHISQRYNFDQQAGTLLTQQSSASTAIIQNYTQKAPASLFR